MQPLMFMIKLCLLSTIVQGQPMRQLSEKVELTIRHESERNMLIIDIANPLQMRLYFSVSINGETFYAEGVTQPQYTKPFDMSTSEDGKYKIAVSSGKWRIEKNVRVLSHYVYRKKFIISPLRHRPGRESASSR